jgi:hypothetical protein
MFISSSLLVLLIIPVNIIKANLSEPVFEETILGEYIESPHLQLQALPSQIMYVVTTTKFPFVILAVGEVNDGELIWSEQPKEGAWLFILIIIVLIYSGVRWRKYSIWGSISVLFKPNKPLKQDK